MFVYAERWRAEVRRLVHWRARADVDDRTIADRVRSTLGPVEKRLDLPHLHVMVVDHEVFLHGEVADEHEAVVLARIAGRVCGVHRVTSHVHVGLLPSDTRPSVGRRRSAPSPAMRHLVDAARTAGATDERAARAAIRATLTTLVQRIPGDERAHLVGHLPADVRKLAEPPRRRWRPAGPRTEAEFVATVELLDSDLNDPRAVAIVEAVVATLRAIVPEEAADVAAVLPTGLRELWLRRPASPASPARPASPASAASPVTVGAEPAPRQPRSTDAQRRS